MAAEQIEPESPGASCLELNCSNYLLKPARVSSNELGSTFKVRCGPLTEADLAGLEHAAQVGMPVRLSFSDGSTILLSRVRVELIATGWVWIEGLLAANRR